MAFDHIILLFALFVGPVPAVLFNQFPIPFNNPYARAQKLQFDKFKPQEHCTAEEIFNKDLDIVIYGATGYTGKLAAQYLAKGHPDNPRWAIAGRDKMKIDYVYWYALGSNNSKPERLTIGLRNEFKLVQMARRARAIVNFAGPFEDNGCEALIRASLQGCAHYVDITEETYWKYKMLKKYETAARERGIAIVQSAGFSALAGDFLVMSAMNDARKMQEQTPHDVALVWMKFNDGVSGTQLWSVDNSTLRNGGVPKDPYILAEFATDRQRADVAHDGGIKLEGQFNIDANVTLNKWDNADIDCPVIRRSIAVTYPEEALHLVAGRTEELLKERRRFLQDPQTDPNIRTVDKFPKFGVGPPLWCARNGTFSAMAIATNNKGKKRVTMNGRGGPAFMGSAKMALELAMGLAFHGPAGSLGGYLTPALALGVEYLESRLTMADNGKFVKILHDSM